MSLEVDPLGCLEQMEMETKASTLELESIWGKSMNDDSGVIHTWVVSQNLVYLKETNNNIQYIYII